MPEKHDDPHSVIPVGGPLYLAEARYLQDELKKIGIASRVRSDRSLGSRRGRIHRLFVCSEDAASAQLAREKLLDDIGYREQDGSDDNRKLQKGPLVFGVLGLVTGFRVGGRLLKSPWLAILLAGFLGTLAFCATRLFFPTATKIRR